MKNPTQSFFYFTKAEKRGIFLILILSVILLIVPGFIKSINQDAKLKFEEIEHKDAGEVKSKREYVKPKYSFKSSKNVKNLINKLDINSASKDQLLQLLLLVKF